MFSKSLNDKTAGHVYADRRGYFNAGHDAALMARSWGSTKTAAPLSSSKVV
jgi:hypothetical protein